MKAINRHYYILDIYLIKDSYLTTIAASLLFFVFDCFQQKDFEKMVTGLVCKHTIQSQSSLDCFSYKYNKIRNYKLEQGYSILWLYRPITWLIGEFMKPCTSYQNNRHQQTVVTDSASITGLVVLLRSQTNHVNFFVYDNTLLDYAVLQMKESTKSQHLSMLQQ